MENGSERREHVGQRDDVVAHGVGGDLAWPAHDKGLAEAALVFRVFAAAQVAVDGEAGCHGLAGVAVAHVDDAAVVARENDERVFSELEAIERNQDLADTPIELVDEVAVTAVGAAGEARIRRDGAVHGVGRKIEEERGRVVGFDPTGRLCSNCFHDTVYRALLADAGRRAFGTRGGDDDLFTGDAADDVFIFDKRVRAVARIAAEAVEIIEADGARAGLQRLVPISLRDAGLKAEMPLAERAGAVALRLAECSERDAAGLNVERSSRREDFSVLDRRAPVVAAGQQAVARRRADGAGSVGVREASALTREAIQIWGVQAFGPVRR